MRTQIFKNARNDKALNNQGFVVSNMAEAMGFELLSKVPPQTCRFQQCITSLCSPQNPRESRLSHDYSLVAQVCI